MPASFPSEIAAFIESLPLAPLSFRPDIRLHRPTPSSGLQRWLEAMGSGNAPPYWAYAWAGGAALALYLRDHPEVVEGRSILDFGAGSGLVAIAAARAGARSVAAFEPDAIGRVAIGLNARANAVEVRVVETPDMAEIILAGDVFYDSEVAARTLPMLAGLAAAGARVLIGDPFRRDLPLARLTALAEFAVPDMGGGRDVRAAMFELDMQKAPPVGDAF